MRKVMGFRFWMVILVVTFMFTGMAVAADAPKFTGTASVDVMSNYVWRGIKLSKDFVVQPSLTIGYGGFSMNMWANVDLNYFGKPITGKSVKHTETDITLSYTYPIDKLSLTGGYIYYGLDSVPDTQEIFITAAYDTLLNPSLTLYYDIKEGKGGFLTASVSHSFELSKDMPLKIGGLISYNLKNEIMSTGAAKNFNNFYNAELSASLTVPITKQISIAPKVAYSFALSSDAKDAIAAMDVSGKGKKNVFYGGLNLTLSF